MKKRKSYNYGKLSEYIVCVILFFKGYRILKIRYKTKIGEIDIIAKKGGVLSFVEVKARADNSLSEVLSQRQKKRIVNASKYFISNNSKFSNLGLSYDLVVFNNIFSFKHIKNAWSIE